MASSGSVDGDVADSGLRDDTLVTVGPPDAMPGETHVTGTDGDGDAVGYYYDTSGARRGFVESVGRFKTFTAPSSGDDVGIGSDVSGDDGLGGDTSGVGAMHGYDEVGSGLALRGVDPNTPTDTDSRYRGGAAASYEERYKNNDLRDAASAGADLDQTRRHDIDPHVDYAVGAGIGGDAGADRVTVAPPTVSETSQNAPGGSFFAPVGTRRNEIAACGLAIIGITLLTGTFGGRRVRFQSPRLYRPRRRRL
jgi:hypothetical protein